MIEYRNISYDQIPQQEGSIYAIGSEHCCIKSIKSIRDFLQSPFTENLTPIRLVSPRVGERFMKEYLDMVDILFNRVKIDSIVINDYGVMYELAQYGKPLIAGRMLIRASDYDYSFLDTIHPEESQEVILNKSAPNILHEEKIEFLKSFGVTAAELCPTNSVFNTAKLIQNKGINIHIHYRSIISALSRICSIARLQNKKVAQDCSELCDVGTPLELARIFGKPEEPNNFLELSQIEKESFPQYVLWGNAVYRIIDNSNFPYHEFDTIIYDNRFLVI